MPDPDVKATRVAVILPPNDRREPSLFHLLKALSSDPRFSLVGLETAKTGAKPLTKLLDSYLAIEARFATPRAQIATSAFDQIEPSLVPIAQVKPLDGAAPNIDVILDMAEITEAEADAFSRLAAHGLWRLSTTCDAAGIAEAFSGASTSNITLKARKHGAWQILDQATYDVKFLASRNRAYLRAKAVHVVLRRLGNLNAPPATMDIAPVAADLHPFALLTYAGRVIKEATHRLRDKFRRRLGGRPGRFDLRVCKGTPLDFDLASGIAYEAPKGHFWADPFIHISGTETHVFYEDFDYARRLGHLSVARLDGDTLTVLGDTHRPPHHLSYPHVFDHDGEVYMLLESGQIARQELWRATDYPLKWTLDKSFFEGVRCADTTLFMHGGAWWLFTNICRDDFNDFCSELYAFRVDGPALTKIEPHRLNPIVLGADVARGAGRVFEQDGKLYRPSQDNTHGTYGYGLNIMEIEALSLDTYSERRVRHITPDDAPGIIGCHHIDRVDEGRVIVDMRYP
jgi:hypothetical protein